MESVKNAKRVHIFFVNCGYDKESAIFPSKRKNKKRMVLDPNTAKWNHFGDRRYKDLTVHQDEVRRDKYHSRMRRSKTAYKYSPGYLSLVLLW
jgi:hypothetical protein